MIIIETKNYKEMSGKASELIIDGIKRKPNLAICFATGNTPLGIYRELVKAHKKKKVSFSHVRSFNSDEYYPISRKDKNSYNYYMNKNLFDKVDIKKKNINILNGEAGDWKKECLEYEKKIRKNKIDLCILGVGRNGHIAFNEPGSSFNSKTRLIKLTYNTIKTNSRFFKDKNKVLKSALTIGIKTIINARKIILIASGKEKAIAVSKLVGRIDSKWPVSVLRRHKNLIVIIDKGAGRLLK